MTLSNIILAITTTTTALIAGLLYAYACSVNAGLGALPDMQYLAAMQSINKAIQNPLFFISFIGTLVLLPLSTYMHYTQPLTTQFWLLLAATFVYIIGVIGITALGNIPLNNMLDAVNLKMASIDVITLERAKFERAWNTFNSIRTVAAVVALVLTILACIYQND
jgi:uncharacterized membrane protein